MNFIEEFKKGQKDKNKGLYMGEGLDHISKAINGVQKHRMYGLASAPKIGKSTFADYGFILSPYLDWIENPQNTDIEWIYFSFELDRVSKEFDFATFFLFWDYGIETIRLDEGQTVTVNGKQRDIIDLSPDYLRGRLIDDNGQVIKVKPTILEVLKEVYEKRIVPLFGEYSTDGNLLTKGKIQFIENKDNPTGLYKFLMKKAENEGRFIRNEYRITGYKPDSPNKMTIIVLDHLRKIPKERGFSIKENVDKMIEYMVEFLSL